MAFGISDNPELRKLLGWNPLAPQRPRLPGMMSQEDVDLADEEEPPLGPFSDENAPEIVHVDQQMAAAAKSPTITPAAGSSMFAHGAGVPGLFGDVARGIGAVVEPTIPYLKAGIPGMGPVDLGDSSILEIAHAAGGGAPSAPIMDDAERRRRAAEINDRNRIREGGGVAEAAANPTPAPARPPEARTTVPLAGSGHDYTNEDLDIEKAARLRGEGPSRGGYMGGQKLEDVAYLPDSVLEEAANRRMLAEVQRKPGALSGPQEAQLEFVRQQGEIKFAAMDKIIDAERDRRIARAQSDPTVPPNRKAAAIEAAHADAEDKKLRNRQIGMAGWPRRQADELDPFTGEPMTPSYGPRQ